MSYHSLPQRCIATCLILSNLLIAMLPMSFASVEERSAPQVTGTKLCLPHQSSALLRFKHSLEDCLYSNVLRSWSDNGSDCCHWEGITCDNHTGFVIAVTIRLVTQVNCYVDSIPSSLFELVQLRHLDLSFNQFNGTIPKRLGELTHLTHLNLGRCYFSGQVPVELSQLTRLVFLNLAGSSGNLQLQEPNFRILVKGLVQLQELVLDGVMFSRGDMITGLSSSSLRTLQRLSLAYCNIGAFDDTELFHLPSLSYLDLAGNNLQRVPKFLENLASLNELHLSDCDLQGKFPQSIFLLPKLETLDISLNEELVASLPTKELARGVNIRNLDLSSIKELADDHVVPSNPTVEPQLQAESNGTSESRVTTPAGSIPNGVCSFPYLTSLTLKNNYLNGTIPTCLLSLPSLKKLDLSNNRLNGSIPSSLFSIPSMKELQLGNNMFSGSLPKFNKPNSNLELLSLDNNLLSGDISSFMKKLPSLKSVRLSSNDFTGIINYSLLSSLQNLTELDASNNKRLIVESSSYSTTDAHNTSFSLLQLQTLNLSSCSIQSFPKFICQLQRLSELDLSDNDMEGKIPSCLWNISGLRLQFLDRNKLDGFQQPVNVTSISSQFEFSLKISNNLMIGSIPSFICKITSLGTTYVDMSNNSLSGGIPDCLYKMNVVKLGKNQLRGQIPSGLICNMQLLDLNDNFLTGKIPKSLTNCTDLEALNLGNNELEDEFPSWLDQLNELKVLILRSNHLYGPIPAFASPQVFPALKVLDISNNNFSGALPHQLFDGLKAMMYVGATDVLQVQVYSISFFQVGILDGEVEQTIKGKSYLIKHLMWPTFNFIDLSNNKFSGKIPEELGRLKYLRGLNISNNHFDGLIPRSFGSLLQMEWLDLSQNRISGAIPEELVALTFLSILNLSYNDLQGRIPQGNQFDTFGASSFEGNPKLCGQQVNRTCFDGHGQNDHTLDYLDEGKRRWQEGWKYGSVGVGFAVGLMIITLPILFSHRVANWYWNQTDGIVDHFVHLATNLCVSKFW